MGHSTISKSSYILVPKLRKIRETRPRKKSLFTWAPTVAIYRPLGIPDSYRFWELMQKWNDSLVLATTSFLMFTLSIRRLQVFVPILNVYHVLIQKRKQYSLGP